MRTLPVRRLFPILLATALAACASRDSTTEVDPPAVEPAASGAKPASEPAKVEGAPPTDPAADARSTSLAEAQSRIRARNAMVLAARVKVDLVVIESALENHAINNSGRYPDTLEWLVTPDVNGQRYIRATEVPRDPWGREYLYAPSGPGAPLPKVYTLGADGVVGGTDENADVDSLSLRGE